MKPNMIQAIFTTFVLIFMCLLLVAPFPSGVSFLFLFLPFFSFPLFFHNHITSEFTFPQLFTRPRIMEAKIGISFVGHV